MARADATAAYASVRRCAEEAVITREGVIHKDAAARQTRVVRTRIIIITLGIRHTLLTDAVERIALLHAGALDRRTGADGGRAHVVQCTPVSVVARKRVGDVRADAEQASVERTLIEVIAVGIRQAVLADSVERITLLRARALDGHTDASAVPTRVKLRAQLRVNALIRVILVLADARQTRIVGALVLVVAVEVNQTVDTCAGRLIAQAPGTGVAQADAQAVQAGIRRGAEETVVAGKCVVREYARSGDTRIVRAPVFVITVTMRQAVLADTVTRVTLLHARALNRPTGADAAGAHVEFRTQITIIAGKRVVGKDTTAGYARVVSAYVLVITVGMRQTVLADTVERVALLRAGASDWCAATGSVGTGVVKGAQIIVVARQRVAKVAASVVCAGIVGTNVAIVTKNINTDEGTRVAHSVTEVDRAIDPVVTIRGRPALTIQRRVARLHTVAELTVVTSAV